MIDLERRDGRVLRIGHRGAAALAPENTIASFRAALAYRVDLIEFDVLDLRAGPLGVSDELADDVYRLWRMGHSQDAIFPVLDALFAQGWLAMDAGRADEAVRCWKAVSDLHRRHPDSGLPADFERLAEYARQHDAR